MRRAHAVPAQLVLPWPTAWFHSLAGHKDQSCLQISSLSERLFFCSTPLRFISDSLTPDAIPLCLLMCTRCSEQGWELWATPSGDRIAKLGTL